MITKLRGQRQTGEPEADRRTTVDGGHHRPHSAGRAERPDRLHGRDRPGRGLQRSPAAWNRPYSHTKDSGVYRGQKPSFTRDQLRSVQDLLALGVGVSAAGTTGLARRTIYRIKDDRADAEAILAKWEREAA